MVDHYIDFMTGEKIKIVPPIPGALYLINKRAPLRHLVDYSLVLLDDGRPYVVWSRALR